MRTVHLSRPGLVVVGVCAVWAATLAGCGNGTEDDGALGAEPGADNGDVDTTTVRSEYRVTATAPWVEKHGLTIDQFRSELNAWQAAGYRMTYIDGYVVNGVDYYNGIWESSAGPLWTAFAFMTQSGYEKTSATLANAGYYPVVVSGYTIGNGDYFAAIWEKATAGTIVEMHTLTNTTLQQQLNAHAAGYRVIHISGFGGTSGDKYAVIWQKNVGTPPKQFVKADTSEAAFQQTFNTEKAAGYHLTIETEYPAVSGIHVVSAFSQGTVVPQVAYGDMPAAAYQNFLADFRNQGFRPVSVSGFSADGVTPEFSTIWQNPVMTAADLATIDNAVNAKLSASGAASLSIAVGKSGRLVFAKAYGQADKASGTPATTASLYRIASISKAITSAAILKLQDMGRLSLKDTLFGTKFNGSTGTGRLPWFGASYPYNYPPCVPGAPCLENITVRDLLAHASGGWSGDLGVEDPMFDNPNTWTQANIINYALNNIPLVAYPGYQYGYSNFGYCLLGRLIERVTGQDYTSWVQQNVLAPAGVAGMQMAKAQVTYTAPEDVEKWPNEVTYYGNDPYGSNVNRMDSHGGWVSTPADLVRFTTRVDSLSPPADILLLPTENDMISDQLFKTTGSYVGYGLGWYLSPTGVFTNEPACDITANLLQPSCVQFGNGALDGTSTESGSTRAGTSWAIFANAGSVPDPFGTMTTIIENVSKWPSYDLFNPPNLAIYDPTTPGGAKTQCSAGGVTMHCCPTGYVMIGADATNDVFKCAPVQTTGALTLDANPGTQRSGMHACPSGQVMVGSSVPLNDIICMALPGGSVTSERVDYGTVDAYPMRVCDANPSSAMSGIRVDLNRLLCATDPHLD